MTSPTEVTEMARRAFLERHDVRCSCAPLEVRLEGGRLVCAHCDAPIVPKREDAR